MRSSFIACFLLAACSGGDDGSGTPDGGDPGPDAPGQQPGVPILERPSRGTHACQITADSTVLEGGWLGGAITQVDGAYRVLHSASPPTSYQPRVTLSELSLDPSPRLGTERFSTAGYGRNPALVAGDGTLALAWVDGDTGQSIKVVVLDAAWNSLGGGPTTIPATSNVQAISLVPAGPGFALLWSETGAVRFALLDAMGRQASSPRVLRESETTQTRLVATASGFAALWIEWSPSYATNVLFLALDGGGAPVGSPVQLTSPGANTGYSTPALLSTPAGIFAAWSENTSNGSLEDPKGSSVIRLARLSEGGAVVGAIERLQAPVIDVDNIGPTLAFHDGALAVAWSRGTIIYICGGCVPDHDLELVLLDPTDLVPLGDRITFQGTVGLLNASLAIDAAGDLVGLLDHTYHAWSEGAAVRASCGPR